MYIPNPYFSNVPQLGNLVLDYIFVDDGYPILFTCKNNKALFLCLCRSNNPEQVWTVAEITVETLRRMAHRDISIAQAFKEMQNGKACIVKWDKNNPKERYSVFTTSYLNDVDLPDANVFISKYDMDDAIDYVEALDFQNKLQNMLLIQAQIKSDHQVGYFFSSHAKSRIDYNPVASTEFLADAKKVFVSDTFCSGNRIINSMLSNSQVAVVCSNLKEYIETPIAS